MKHYFVDTNVVIDMLADREEYADAACELLMLQEEERCIYLSVLFLIRLFIIFYVNMQEKKMRFQVYVI